MKIADVSQYHKINQLLTESFKDNKSVNYVLKEAYNDKYISKLIEYSLFVGNRFGEILINNEENATVIMIDPKRKKNSIETIYQDIKFALTISGLQNVRKVLHKEEVTKKKFPKDIDFIQLWFLGVEREQQGKQIGSAFLQNIINYYKGKTEAICLETSTLKNIPFYKKNGFKIYEKSNFGFDFYHFIYKY